MVAENNKSSINTMKTDEEMLESDQSDLLSSKSTNKVIQNFMRCIGALILHVENALSTSNGPVIVKCSSKIKSNDGSDIDIVEHKIKDDPDATKNHLENVKKYVLQLCLLFIQDNIYINCDITFNKIDFYSCLDDSTRSLVINYLTEHVEYLIEHIGFMISMFTEETSTEDARDIRKSLSKIYKQILLLPLNPNLDETPAVFKTLNSSLWYEESILHLSDKLLVLRTSLIKLKKAFKRRNLAEANNKFLEQTPTKRKNNSDIDTPNAKKVKLTPDNVFLIPGIPLSPKKNDINTEKRKIDKHEEKSGTSGDKISILSDTESVKLKKKNKGKDEVKENGIVSIASDTESVKKKKKLKINLENKKDGSIIVPSDSESIKRKKKHKESTGNEENGKIIIHSDTESVKRKKKHKISPENEENGIIIVHADTPTKKKKHQINNENITIIAHSETESIKKIKKKKKHKINPENKTIIVDTETIKKKHKTDKENGTIIVDNDEAQPIKKKKKSKINIENKENETIIVGHDTESFKKKKKHKINKENGTIIVVENDKAQQIKKKNKSKINIESETIIIDNDAELITKKKKPKITKENGIIIINNGAQPIKKNNKSKTNIEDKENETIIVGNDTESIKKKKKHKTDKENGTIIVGSDTESIKKKKKHKINPENRENDPVIIASDTDSVKRKKKIKLKNQENNTETVNNKDAFKKKSELSENELKKEKTKLKIQTENQLNKLISNESDTERGKSKKKLKSNLEINEKEINLETSNSKTQKGKHEKNEENCDTKKQKRSKNESESSIISIGQLFTTQLDIGDKEISFNNKSKELNTTDKEQQDNSVIEISNTEEQTEQDMSQEIFDALSRGELQVDYEDESVNYLNKFTRENELNENERFLFIQDLLLQAKEKNELPKEMKKKLSSLTILIDWEIPPSHEVVQKLTSGATPAELAALKKYNISEKKFNQDEDKTIRRNWKEFCKSHDWDGGPQPFLRFRHGKRAFLKYGERKRFVQYLAKGLPHRILPSIYKRFRTLYRDKNRLGRYTPQEDELILTYCNKITTSKSRFAELANILDRDRPAIERRYRVLTQHYNIPVKWTILIETELVNGLLKATCSKDVDDLRHAKITKEHYKQVAAALEVPWEKVRTHWRKFIYTKLYASEPLYTAKIRSKLIRLLRDSGVTDWKKIDWDGIRKSFDGFTNEFLWGQMMSVRVQNVPKKYRNDLGDVLKFLEKFSKEMYKKGSEPYSNKLIKRYKMFDGSLDTYE